MSPYNATAVKRSLEHVARNARVLADEHGRVSRQALAAKNAACGLAEAQDKIVAVATPEAGQYAAGREVMVGVRRSAGVRAVVLAYVGALAVLLAVLVGTIAVAGWSEGAGALAAIAGVGVYYFALWLFRRKIEHTIQFTITKI